jgi:uncharacterized protein (DUF1330 family)
MLDACVASRRGTSDGKGILGRDTRCQRLRGLQEYIAENQNAFRKFGARYVARGGMSEVVEGSGRSRIVVVEFKDYATALACYHSPEYAKAIAKRRSNAVADIIVVEGYDGPQPQDA